jgi:5-methylcytosine-specific restriction protein B
MSLSEQVLKHVETAYVVPARERGESTIRVKAGDVHRDLRWANRVPSVCTTLSSQKLQKAIGIELIAKEGPPSGQSTTVIFTYRLPSANGRSDSAPRQSDRLERLYGIASEIFRELGGGEKFIREEREKLNFRYDAAADGGPENQK